MDGLECLKQLYLWRAEDSNSLQNKEQVVIGMSATANSAEQTEAYSYGMQAFSVKPVDLNLLKLAIDLKGSQVPLSNIIAAMAAHTGIDPSLLTKAPNLQLARKMTPMSSISCQGAALNLLSPKSQKQSPHSTSSNKSLKLKPAHELAPVPSSDDGQSVRHDSFDGLVTTNRRNSFLSSVTSLLKGGGSSNKIAPL